MMPQPIRRWLVCLGIMLGLVLETKPTAQQCYLNISAYADAAVSGYDSNGNGILNYYGSGFDYSYCEGPYQCTHTYAIQGTVRQTSTQAVWDQIQGAGTEFSQGVAVTPGDYAVEALFYVDCTICAQQVFVTQAVQAVQVPPRSGPCVPVRNKDLEDHHYRFEGSFWNSGGTKQTVINAGNMWNDLVYNFTPATAFREAWSWENPSVRVFAEVMAGLWGHYDPNTNIPDTMRINPEVWGYNETFAQSVAGHEFGHGRGYAGIDLNVAPNCNVADTIMTEPWDPQSGIYAPYLGPGDWIAADRDIP
jgi:hypothetical protein